MSTIRFCQLSALHRRTPDPPWQTPFASISAGTSVNPSPMTSRSSRSNGARRSRSRSRRSSSTNCARKGSTGATQDPLASTEFTYSRFLTPDARRASAAGRCSATAISSGFGDIAGLAAYAKGPKAVFCVQHDYRPTEKTKMDGAVQTVYPRKNWSSLMLFNCDHPVGARAHARRREPRKRRLSASHAMGSRRRISASCRSIGTGSKAGTRSRAAGRRTRCTSPAADRGSSSGRMSTTATCGARSATPCCARKQA